jgi:hypothetical protein
VPAGADVLVVVYGPGDGTGGGFLLAAPVAVSAGYLAGRIVATNAPFTGTQAPVLLIACMMVNTGFALPFVQALYGGPGSRKKSPTWRARSAPSPEC